MSIILKALRRSEQERLSQSTEVLDDKIIARPKQKHQKRSYWLALLVLMNVLLLTFFGWKFVQGDDEDIIVAREAPDYLIDSEKVALVSAKTVTVSEPEVTIAQQVKAKKEVKRLEARQSKVSLPKEPDLKESISEIKVVQEVKLVPQKDIQQPELNLSEDESDLPYLSEMSYNFRRSVPSFKINAFVYSKEPKARFIIVNMRKYGEGETLGEGLVLQEIRSEGVVIEYKEETFLIQR